jgi:hypothetical protein
MAVEAARALDHPGGLGEQSHRTRAPVKDRREGRDGFEWNHRSLGRNHAGGEEGDGHAVLRQIHHDGFLRGQAEDPSRVVSIGRVRMRLPVAAKLHDVLTNESRAVIVGELASRVKSTGKTIETAFALVLTISGGEIVRFQMLEDSFAVSKVTRA